MTYLEKWFDVSNNLPKVEKKFLTKSKCGKIRIATFSKSKNKIQNDWFFYTKNNNRGKTGNSYIPISVKYWSEL